MTNSTSSPSQFDSNYSLSNGGNTSQLRHGESYLVRITDQQKQSDTYRTLVWNKHTGDLINPYTQIALKTELTAVHSVTVIV